MAPLRLGDGALGMFLPPELAEVVNRWRARYDPYLGTIAPHITLTYPPFVREEEWMQVRPGVVRVLREFAPFAVTLRETGTFTAPARVLWLRPEDGGQIVRIQSRLAAAFPQYIPPANPGMPYTPHATLGFFQTQEALDEAERQVRAELTPLRFVVQEISYFVRKTDGGWETRDRMALRETT